jgi:alpha-soluble NSF attachment protein
MSDGRTLMDQADRKAATRSWFGNPMEEAAELYGRAANAYKLSKQPLECGTAYMKQADALMRLNEKDEASNAFLNAAKSLKKDAPEKAVAALKEAIAILSSKGRLATAANNMKQVAEIYEMDLKNLVKALESYEQAAEWYETEDSKA